MNYRHAFHAGNFADVLKHVVVARAVSYLKQKAAPFRVIDTHAGCGVYDLQAEAAQKTNEWRDGILKVQQASFPRAIGELLRPYLETVAACNPDGALRYYPGSPQIVAHLLRAEDRLIANECHAEDAVKLKQHFSRAKNVKVMDRDGWTVLKAVLPPKERRGLTLVDPPFEKPGEFDRLVQSVRDHQRRFATGIQVLWYPIKDVRQVRHFHEQLSGLNLKSCLQCTLAVDEIVGEGPIAASGLAVVNPPFPLHDELAQLLPVLGITLGRSSAATTELTWLAKD